MSDETTPKPPAEVDFSKDPSVTFLSKEYEFACSQMRYYDTQIFDYVKYLFTAYASLISVVALLEKLGGTSNTNFLIISQLLLFVGFCIGVLLVIMIMKTRMFFVVVARYVNTLREFFLAKQNYGFVNKSKMWVGPDIPNFGFSINSAHTWLLLIPVVLNSVVFSVLIFLFIKSMDNALFFTVITFIGMNIVQIVPMRWYATSKMNPINPALNQSA